MPLPKVRATEGKGKLSVHVDFTREESGRWIKRVEIAAQDMLEEMARDGMQRSTELAPVGLKNDPRGPSIIDSMFYDTSGNHASWGSRARHTKFVEEGSSRHFQTGQAKFFWDAQGRWWVPGENMIDHPAVGPHPFLRPALTEVMARLPEYIERHKVG